MYHDGAEVALWANCLQNRGSPVGNGEQRKRATNFTIDVSIAFLCLPSLLFSLHLCLFLWWMFRKENRSRQMTPMKPLSKGNTFNARSLRHMRRSRSWAIYKSSNTHLPLATRVWSVILFKKLCRWLAWITVYVDILEICNLPYCHQHIDQKRRQERSWRRQGALSCPLAPSFFQFANFRSWQDRYVLFSISGAAD